MVFHRQSSKLALGVMRVMGWFPYRWGDDSLLHLPAALGSTGCCIPRSWPWVAWSLAVGTFTVAVCGIETYMGFRGPMVTTIPTLQVARSLYDIFLGIGGIVMSLYALFYSSKLARIINHAEQVCRDFDLRGASTREVSIMCLIFVLAVLIILLCSLSCLEVVVTGATTPLAYVNTLTHLFKNVLLTMITILYNKCISVLTLAYSRATDSIAGQEDSVLGENSKCSHSTILSDTELNKERPLKEEDLYSIGRRILQLQAFHRHINKYFAPAIVMTVVISVFTCILSLFYMSLFPFVNWMIRSLTCIYLFLGTQPLLTLTGASLTLNKKVR